jgi:hypothetical protein
MCGRMFAAARSTRAAELVESAPDDNPDSARRNLALALAESRTAP